MSENKKFNIPADGDEDMKIAGKPEKSRPDGRWEEKEILEQLKTADDDGHLAAAKDLGREIAQKIMRCEEEFSVSSSDDSHLLFHCRLLMLFAVTVGCERYLPNTILARTVINSCHDTMAEICPQMFSGEGDYSTAISFYYLAVRGVGNVEREIGRTFAMICGGAEDEQLKTLGTTLFERCMGIMERRSAQFTKK